MKKRPEKQCKDCRYMTIKFEDDEGFLHVECRCYPPMDKFGCFPPTELTDGCGKWRRKNRNREFINHRVFGWASKKKNKKERYSRFANGNRFCEFTNEFANTSEYEDSEVSLTVHIDSGAISMDESAYHICHTYPFKSVQELERFVTACQEMLRIKKRLDRWQPI